jgi:hypothetical protein
MIFTWQVWELLDKWPHSKLCECCKYWRCWHHHENAVKIDDGHKGNQSTQKGEMNVWVVLFMYYGWRSVTKICG